MSLMLANSSQTDDPFQKSKVQLVLNKPFFGVLVMHLPTIPVSPAVLIAAGCPPTAAVDGEHIYYVKKWVESLTDKQRMGLLAHEVLHPALSHLWRRGARNKHVWRMATDYAVNGILLKDGFELPPGGLYDQAFDGMAAEQIYTILMERGEGEGQDGEGDGQEGTGKGKKKSKKPGEGQVLDGQLETKMRPKKKPKPKPEPKDGDGKDGEGQKPESGDDKDGKDKAGQGDDGEEKDETPGKEKGKKSGKEPKGGDEGEEEEEDGQGDPGSDEGDDGDGEEDGDDGEGKCGLPSGLKPDKEGDEDGEGDGADGGEGDGDEQGDEPGTEPGTEPSDQQQEGEGDTEDHDCGSLDDKEISEEDEEKWRGLLQQAAMVAKARGNLPADLARLVEDVSEPKVPWQQVLEMFVTDIIRDDYDMLKHDRRFMQHGIYLPDLQQNAVKVDVIMDTSGSIGKVELRAFAGEIVGILRSRGISRMRLMTCDDEVHLDMVLSPQDPIPDDFPGGGGTDFREPFKRIEKDLMDKPAVIIYITDMDGTFPDREIGIPTIWLACAPPWMKHDEFERCKVARAPFGTVIRYDPTTEDAGAAFA